MATALPANSKPIDKYRPAPASSAAAADTAADEDAIMPTISSSLPVD